ncbi:DUF3716 domain-containing protein [Aspergillus affinis]|uniref:DUF3716 domain-containing protein n=1 Tax=Aspergillus affinis TaxID=1070780 RepID=UPI0022FF199B|nr:uncharacterized protein KD926_008097 [Aspergillus affinis]KAI9040531.1 hypothetical protein KD926_008097 [Aspergillus affinis]
MSSDTFKRGRAAEIKKAEKLAHRLHLTVSDRYVVELLDPNGSMQLMPGHDGQPDVRAYNNSRRHTTAYLVQERGVKMAVPCESCARGGVQRPWEDCIAVPAFGGYSVHNHACGNCLRSAGKACSLRRDFEQHGGTKWNDPIHSYVLGKGGLLAALEREPKRRSTVGQAVIAGAIECKDSFPAQESEALELSVCESISKSESGMAMRDPPAKGKTPAQSSEIKIEQEDGASDSADELDVWDIHPIPPDPVRPNGQPWAATCRPCLNRHEVPTGNRDTSGSGSAKNNPETNAPVMASGFLPPPLTSTLDSSKPAVRKRNASGEASNNPPKKLKAAVHPSLTDENVPTVTITLAEYTRLIRLENDRERMAEAVEDIARLTSRVKELVSAENDRWKAGHGSFSDR